jgi:hypothetical protein
MAQIVVWIHHFLEFLRLRSPAMPAVRQPAAPESPRLRTHGLRSTSKHEGTR